MELGVTPGSRADGKRLADLGLGKGVLIMAVDRAGDLMVPDGETVVHAGDSLLLVTTRDQLARVQALL